MQIYINNSKYFIIFEVLLLFFGEKSTLGHMQCIIVCRKTTAESIIYNLLPSSHVLALKKKQYKQSSRNHENVTKRRTQYLNPIFRSENIQEKLSVFEILGSFVDLPQLDK